MTYIKQRKNTMQMSGRTVRNLFSDALTYMSVWRLPHSSSMHPHMPISSPPQGVVGWCREMQCVAACWSVLPHWRRKPQSLEFLLMVAHWRQHLRAFEVIFLDQFLLFKMRGLYISIESWLACSPPRSSICPFALSTTCRQQCIQICV